MPLVTDANRSRMLCGLQLNGTRMLWSIYTSAAGLGLASSLMQESGKVNQPSADVHLEY